MNIKKTAASLWFNNRAESPKLVARDIAQTLSAL
jgi:putative heme degradation protein